MILDSGLLCVPPNRSVHITIYSIKKRLLSPSIPFHCFTLSSKAIFSENFILHVLSLFLSVCLTDLMTLDHLLDLFAHRFLCFSSIFFCFSNSQVRRTRLASSPVNFWVYDKLNFVGYIVI